MEENIIDDIEHVEVSAILDSNGDAVENFRQISDKSKKTTSGIYINIGPNDSKLKKLVFGILGLISAALTLCALSIIVPIMILCAISISLFRRRR